MKHTMTRLALFLFLGLQILLPKLVFAQQHETYDVVLAEHRAEYKADFVTNPRSPLTASDTAFLDFFPVNYDWIFPLAKFERTPNAEPFIMMTYSGQKRDYVQFGILKFVANGQPQTLNIYQNIRLIQDSTYRDHLFLPFKDLTNGEESYGGGRYLDFKQSDIVGDQITLDFNLCYNPWCAFSDGFNCPIPPSENHLEIEVPAGERNFKGEKKH
jgi:uncharacterized protein (DUF1684 family)